jgi:AraC-like DNA-binding protein
MKRLGRIETKLWLADDLGDAELLRGSFADYAYDTHTHARACFALITRGAIRIRMRGAEFVARAGDLYAIDAEEPHTGWPIDDGGWSLRTLYVDVARLRAIIFADEASAAPFQALRGPIIRDTRLIGLFQDVHASSEAGEPPLRREERYTAFVARLFERHTRAMPWVAKAGNEPRAIRLAREFLDGRVDERLRLADIAKAAELPPFRLLRAFERTTGMTPHCYQRQARVRHAAGMILRGHPLGQVAAAAGFADQAHLTRCFRGSMGITPGAYRDAYRGTMVQTASNLR